MDEYNYNLPVSKLLNQGDCRKSTVNWPNYLELGLSQEHIPELIRMFTDEALYWADSESLEVWAPMHAWRTLGQLQSVEAIEPLLEQLYRIDDDDDDWIGEEFPEVFSMIGPQAISSLSSYLAAGYGLFAKICVAKSIEKIGNQYPESKEQCVEILTKQLEKYHQNDQTLNGFLISYLVDLQAVDSIGVIRKAFQHECVDYSIQGDIEDAEIILGIRESRSTPPLNFKWMFDNDRQASNTSFIRTEAKVGRNDPCPCGSGKKYKKCCLKKA
jgi:hypothetical protein